MTRKNRAATPVWERFTETHRWQAATWLVLTDKQAREASIRGVTSVEEHTDVVVLEIACRQCRRPYAAVVDQPCVAVARDPDLIGGPIGTRRKRKQP